MDGRFLKTQMGELIDTRSNSSIRSQEAILKILAKSRFCLDSSSGRRAIISSNVVARDTGRPEEQLRWAPREWR